MKKTDYATFKWLYQVPRKSRGIVAVLTLVQILYGLSGVSTALLLKEVVDSAVREDLQGFGRAVVLTVLLIIAVQSLGLISRWLYELGRSTFENMFKLRLTENILKRSFASVSAVHSGEWMNRLTNDTKVVADGYIEILPGVFEMFVRLCSALVMIIALDYRFALLILFGGALVIVFTYVFRRRMKLFHKIIQEEDGRLRIFLQERIASLIMIKSFVAEEQTTEGAAEKMERHKAARMRRNRFANICNAGFGIAMQGMFLFGICYCAWQMMKGNISYGTLAAVVLLLEQIQSPVANITGYFPRFYAMLASAERLMEAESFPEDQCGEMLTRDEIGSLYDQKLDRLVLENVNYAYYPPVTDQSDFSKDQMPIVLENLTMTIRKGEYIAFTGHSGCGKSTVLKLLMCMYAPDSGTLSIVEKDKNAMPLTPSYRRLFAYVPQGNQLMNGTIREILSFSDDSGVNEERICEALKIACADEFIAGMKDGIDTRLGERGTGLSEGQMQRIAIARALYSQAPILLLDEATSALDAATEEKLLCNLRDLTNKTVIIVTHRPAALAICDRVLDFTENGVQESMKPGL